MVAGSKNPEQALVQQLRVDIPSLVAKGPGPYRVEVDIAAAWFAKVLASTDAEVKTPGFLTGELSFQGKTALFRGDLRASFEVPCARCLAAACVDAGGSLCVHFERNDSQRSSHTPDDEDEEEIDTGSPEQFTFDGTTLDLAPMVVEQVVMAYPMRALCARGEACRGLCMQCGQDLNDQPESGCSKCSGTPEVEDEQPASPWQAALRKLRDTN